MVITEWTLNIPNWTPTPLNKLLGSHWGAAGRKKAADSQVVAIYGMKAGITPARGKRRVDTIIIHPKGKRFCDKDAYHKSLLDALVSVGHLKNDSHEWVEFSPPEFARGETLRTIITITDM